MKLGAIAGFIAVLSILPTTECLKSQGKAFVLTFLDNVVEYWQDLPLEVWVTNEGSSDATVSISAPRDNNLLLPECTGDKTVSISAGGQHHFSVCWWAKIMKGDADVNNKVIRIDSDVDVSVIALNKEAFSADAFQVLPIDSLGSSYYSLVSGPGKDHPNTLAVIATEDDTSVTISVPETDITDGPPPAFNYRCLVHESGSTFTIRLFAHQVFYIMSFADISGTKILASNPVAVFNGNTRAAEPASESSRDHTCSQAISSGNWDKEYYYSPVYRSSTPGDMIRVQTNTPNTVITYSQANGQSGQVTLQTGEWTELALDDQAYLSSSNKFSAVACGVTQVGTPDGMIRDPSLRNLQGVTQWTSSYVFPAVTSAESTLNGGTEQPYTLSYFQVTIATADRAGLRLDGATVNPDCVAAPGPTSNPRESCVVVVSGGQSHVLNHVSGAEFGAYMFATNDKETISTTLALNAPAQANPCEETVMRRGDEIDNDCDGSLDEEVCDGLDNDGDGKIDEDCQQSSGQARGRTYVISFPDNSKSDGSASDLDTLELYISPQNTEENTTVTISTPLEPQTFLETRSAPPLLTAKVNIPTSLRLPQSSGKFTRTILIEASDDIVVYALNKIKFSSDGYLAIPVDATGYDYYTASITVTDSNDVAEIAVTASEIDTTNLEITLADNAGVAVNFLGTTYTAGQVIRTSLQQYETLQLQSPQDLTGTRVLSLNNKRISVFSGNRRPIIGDGNARDHIVEQMIPVPVWGREFFTNPIKRDGTEGQLRGDIFRVIASQDNTDVTVSSNGDAAGSYNIPNKGGFLELEVASTEHTMISTTSPALVVQFSKTQKNSNSAVDKGDPSMTLVISKESWTNDYRFVTPRSGKLEEGSTTEYAPYTSRMSLVIETQFISKLRYKDVDTLFSTSFPTVQWNVIPGSNPQISAATVDVEFGQNYVTAVDDVVFGAMIYGASDREFYSNPISLRLHSGACVITETTIGDGIDNDCDNAVDEELCNGYDDDNDGAIDEDCSMPPAGDSGRYIFNFMENNVEYPLVGTLTILASSTCSEVANVRMRTPGAPSTESCDINVMIPSGEMVRFSVPDAFRQYGSAKFNKTIIIESSCPIDVAPFNTDRFSNDAFKVFPDTQLGTEYRPISYYPATLGTVFSVIATAPAQVNVQLPIHAGNPEPADVIHPSDETTSVSAGSSFSVDLAEYESFQVVSEGDLSGSVITATEPVAVFSGNIRVGINAKSRDHIVEQLSPWAEASNEWIVVANGMTTEEIVKFTCTAGSTIQFPAYEDYSGDTFTFSASEGTASATVPQNYAAKVTASGGNCQLMLITISQASKNHPFLGDPTMSAIVPVSQYITSASFAIPVKPWRKLATGEVDDYKATLVVVALTTERSSIRLDGSAINSWQTISGSSYSVARVEVTRKDNPEAAVLNSLNGEKFSARLWGVADRESFAYTLGIEY